MSPAAKEQTPEITILKITEIAPGDNYRKTIDKKKLKELTETVRRQDIIEPIIVRKRAKGKGYEIVDGERRWMAARDADKKTIPAIIKALTDAEALEMALIVNTQSEDVNPMEEAMGFKRLLEMGGHTSQTLAARTGKSLAYVTGRLKLNGLSKEVQKKLLSGELLVGHGLLLTRLKNLEDMNALADEIVDNNLSVQDADESLNQFSCTMDRARFDTKECNTCPARSRTQTLLFPEAANETDTCFDRSCFQKKDLDHIQKFASELEQSGIQIITDEKKAKTLASYSSKTSRRLNLEKGEHMGEDPKNKKKCQGCIDHRAFFFYDAEGHGGRRIESGWICLDKQCLDKMNAAPIKKTRSADPAEPEIPNSASAPEPEEVSGSARVHAMASRDRFLVEAVGQAAQENQTLQLRLMIHHLISKVLSEDARTDLLHQFVPGHQETSFYTLHGADFYPFISLIPVDQLGGALRTAVIASIAEGTDAEVLLGMTSEAGVDLPRDYSVDEAWLKTRTKDELVQFAASVAITQAEIMNSMKKPAMIEHILAWRKPGQVPHEILCLSHIMTASEIAGEYGQEGPEE